MYIMAVLYIMDMLGPTSCRPKVVALNPFY